MMRHIGPCNAQVIPAVMQILIPLHGNKSISLYFGCLKTYKVQNLYAYTHSAKQCSGNTFCCSNFVTLTIRATTGIA